MINRKTIRTVIVAAATAISPAAFAGGLLGGAVNNVGGAVSGAVGAGAGAAGGLAGGGLGVGGGGGGSSSGLLGATVGSNGITSGYSSSSSASGSGSLLGNREGVGGGRPWGMFEETTKAGTQPAKAIASRAVPKGPLGLGASGNSAGDVKASGSNSRSSSKTSGGGLGPKIDELASGVRLGRQVQIDTQRAGATGTGRASGEASAKKGSVRARGSSDVAASASARR